MEKSLARTFSIYLLFAMVLAVIAPSHSFAQSEESKLTPSLVIDEKGEQWIRLSEAGKPDQLVRLAEAKEKDVFAALNTFDFKSIPAQSIKQFGPEYIKFSSALLIVQMGMCFGNKDSLSGFSMISSPATPTCVDDFLAHMTDWKGWVGFYFFMLGNRYTSTSLMKVASLSLHHMGKTKNIPQLRRQMAPLFGYLGMAGGSLASQVVHHFLSAPSWGQCIDLMSEEGLGSLPCREAFTHFLSVEDFWDDFAAGTMSMITSSAAATVTHLFLGKSPGFIKDVALLAQRGARVVGGNSKALELVAKLGSRAITGVRVVKNLTVVSGVPGVVVFVTTQIGQFVLFLAWDEVLKNPIARMYYDWDTSASTRNATLAIINAAKANQKIKWEKPIVKTEKICRGRYQAVTCTEKSVDPLMESLKNFAYGAKRFRSKVLMNPANAAIAGWSGKMAGIVSKYKFSKSIIEHLSKERAKNLDYSMTATETGLYVLTLWKNTLENELPLHPNVPKKVKPLLTQLEASLAISYAAIQTVNEKAANGKSPAHINYFDLEMLETISKVPLNTNRENAIKKALKDLQAYSQTSLEKDTAMIPSIGTECNLLPQLCLARDVTLAIDLRKSFNDKTDPVHYEMVFALFQVFGDELSNLASWEMLCGNASSLELNNLDNNGRKASMTLPRLLKLSRSDFEANCYDHSTLRDKYDFTASDVTRPWIYEGRIYKNALDLLASKNLSWTVANTPKDIEKWWTNSAFKPFSKFLFEMAKLYQGHLQTHLFSQIDDVTPEQLIHMSSPQMRGGALDYKIVSFNGEWERPSLAVSLMAQSQHIIDTLKYYGPPGADHRTLDELKLAMARYILGVKVVPNINSMNAVWATYVSKSSAPDVMSVINAQEEFDQNLRETILGKERAESIVKLRKEVIRLKDLVFLQLNQRPYGDLSGPEKTVMRKRAEGPIVNGTDYVTLNPQEQKLFATFILFSESLNNLTVEIGELYDKLGAKPFTGM